MTAGFCSQGLRTLYIGNEDPITSLVIRLVNNLTGMTKQELMDDPKTAMTIAASRGYDKATFAGLSPGSLTEIQSLIVKHKPDVLVVDQLRNILAKSENRTTQLETVARGMRDFARKYKMLVISLTQAADSARDKIMPNMGDIDGSNIGIPGACDAMIMVGMNASYEINDQRHMYLVKNKLTGDHENWVLRIDKQLSRVLEPEDLLHKAGE
jgi:replicative DNA helicase